MSTDYSYSDEVVVNDIASPFDGWEGTVVGKFGVSRTGLRVDELPHQWYYRVTFQIGGRALGGGCWGTQSQATLTFNQDQLLLLRRFWFWPTTTL